MDYNVSRGDGGVPKKCRVLFELPLTGYTADRWGNVHAPDNFQLAKTMCF